MAKFFATLAVEYAATDDRMSVDKAAELAELLRQESGVTDAWVDYTEPSEEENEDGEASEG
jgi:hypothetical protein